MRRSPMEVKISHKKRFELLPEASRARARDHHSLHLFDVGLQLPVLFHIIERNTAVQGLQLYGFVRFQAGKDILLTHPAGLPLP